MKCKLHNIEHIYTCPVCEARDKYRFIPGVEAFDAGYAGKAATTPLEAYQDGADYRQQYGEKNNV